MADISMCINRTCSLRETCYRFKAKASDIGWGQSYGVFSEVNGKCDYYWPFKNQKELDKLDIQNDW